MKFKPKCSIENCENSALILFGGNWVCGECMAKFDKMNKEEQFQNMQEKLKCL